MDRGGGGWRATDHAGLLIGSLNVQSVKPKLLELSQEMHRFNYDVMALQETWLKPSTPNRLLSLPGYQIHRTDRPNGRGYGGVALAVKTGIDAAQLKVPEQRHPGSALETLWMLLKLDGGRQVIVASVYRPPSRTVAALSSDFTDLEAQYQRVIVDHPNTDILICGDLNCDLRKPESDQGCRRLSQFISDFSLHHYQAIRSPTYRTGSLLDVCIAKQSHSIVRRGVRFCHFSPHLFLRAFIRTSKPRLKQFTVQTRSVTSIDLSSFYADLRRVDWTPIFSVPSVSHKWQLFLNMFSPVLDHHAPMKSVTIRDPTAPPVSSETSDLMARRRGALRVWGHGSSEYRRLNRAVRSAIRRDTRADVCRRIEERGPNSVWRSTRDVIGGRSSGPRTLPSVSADCMNEYFVQVGPRVAGEVAD